MQDQSQGGWVAKLQRSVGGVSVFDPHSKTKRHPAPGYWAVMGPTGEYDFSAQSSEHAAMLYLAHYCGDQEAQRALAPSGGDRG